MKKLAAICLSSLAILFATPFAISVCGSANADTVTVSISGTASGTLDGDPFTDKSFEWTLTYDTLSFILFKDELGEEQPDQPIFLNPASVINIEGNPSPINVNQEHGLWVYNTATLWMAPMFMVSGEQAPDILNILTVLGDPAWDGFSGPYQSTNISASDFSQFNISTDQGQLTMSNESSTVTSVGAVPEPSVVAMIGIAVAGMALLTRSRKKH